MKKRVLSILLAAALIVGLLPQIVLFASAEVVGGVCGADGDNLTWTLDTATGVLTIQGSGEMHDYGSIGDFYFFAPWNLNDYNIYKVLIDDGVTSIGNNAFDGCNSLTSMTIPDSVTSIGEYAFYNCGSLTEVTIGNGVTSIGDSAFRYCTGLTSVTIPDNVTSIGDGAFVYCESLESITVSENNSTYSSIDGVLYNKDKTVLILCPAGKSGSYTIPDGVTSIGDRAFWCCNSLTSVTISDSVTSIGDGAFAVCEALTSVTIPDSVTSIGGSAFVQCTSLTNVTIGNGVTSIGVDAFWECESLTSVTIGSGVTSISDGVFAYCSSLTSMMIPNSVTSIGDNAFYACLRLTSVEIPDSVISIGDRTFMWCGLKSVTIPDGVASIGEYAFSSCEDLTGVTIPNSVTSIGDYAFGDPSVAVIYGYRGSTAEAYAKEYGYQFVAIDSPSTTPKFTDVPAGAYYEKAVAWAVENGVTKGTSPTTFRPEDFCTRAQIVTFLWRACGEPTPTTSNNPFADVKEGQYYYNAVLWAVEKGITTGTSANRFGVDDTCTRAQAVTFQWRAAGKPTPENQTNKFVDVKTGDYFYEAVLWAVENGITSGTTATTFRPKNGCTRAQIVTFLYRDMAER